MNNPKALVSRYSQGVYHPEKKTVKHALGEATNSVEFNSRPIKRPKNTETALNPIKPLLNVQGTVASARQSLKEKQLLKDKRARKTGTNKAIKKVETAAVNIQTSSKYSYVQSKINTNQRDSQMSNSTNTRYDDSGIADLDASASFDRFKVSTSSRKIHVGRNSSIRASKSDEVSIAAHLNGVQSERIIVASNLAKEQDRTREMRVERESRVVKTRNQEQVNIDENQMVLRSTKLTKVKAKYANGNEEQKRVIKKAISPKHQLITSSRDRESISSRISIDRPYGRESVTSTIQIDRDLIQECFSPPRLRFKSKTKRFMPFHDPLVLDEYQQDIYAHWRQLELKTTPIDYMHIQTEITIETRLELISWILQVHYQFKLQPETLYLTINLIDRTLSRKPISVNKLQLVGITSLLIASKYEEIKCPSLSDLVFITNQQYEEEEIVRAERHLLGLVNYNLGHPNPLNYLKRLMQGKECIELEMLANYFLESMIIGYQFIQVKSSMMAAVAMFLALKVLYEGDWTREMQILIQYGEGEIVECVYAVLEYLRSSDGKVLYDKYALPKYSSVSVGMHHFMRNKSLV